MEQMICANAEKCGEKSCPGRLPHAKDGRCDLSCENGAKCIPYKPKDTAMEKECANCRHSAINNKTGEWCNRGPCHSPELPLWQPIIKDTTMTVSFQDLKEKGACEKGLIWFYETFGSTIEVAPNVVITAIKEDKNRKLRDVYCISPDSWIRWMEEKYTEKPRFNSSNIYIAKCTYNYNKLFFANGKYRWQNLVHTGTSGSVMVPLRGGPDFDKPEDALAATDNVNTFPDLKSFAEWLYKETH